MTDDTFRVPETTLTTRKPKLVKIFAAASFLHDVGAEMVFSLWPLFVTQTLGASKEVLGLLDGLGDALVSISQAVSGYLSDRLRKRKLFVWLGYLSGALARIGYALSTHWAMLIPFRMMDRAGKMRGAPRDAMISDISNHGNRGTHFGFLRAMDNSGAVVGILLAMILIGAIGYRSLFILAAIPSLLSVLLVVFFVRERKAEGMKVFKGIHLKDLSKNLRLYFLLSAVFAVSAFSYSFLLLAAAETGLPPQVVAFLYLLFTLVAAASSLPFGKLADKIGRKPVLLFALLCWAGVLVAFLSSWHFLTILAAFILYGLHKGASDPVERTIVAELAPDYAVASTLGGFQMIVGLCSLPSSIIAGVLWQRVGFAAPFLFSLALTAVAFTLLLFVKEKK